MNNNTDFLKRKRKFNVLLVLDNLGDSISLLRAAVRVLAQLDIHVIKTGILLKNMLLTDSLLPRPDMILLDINLPGINGLDLLKIIKLHKKYKSIPVIILTTSLRDYLIDAAYKYHANTYFSKKVLPLLILQFVIMLNNYWFTNACLPKSLLE